MVILQQKMQKQRGQTDKVFISQTKDYKSTLFLRTPVSTLVTSVHIIRMLRFSLLPAQDTCDLSTPKAD